MTPAAAALGIGTATFLANYGLPSEGSDPAEARLVPRDDLLRAALSGGVRYLDTAADYGDGELEVGRVLADGVRVCTKIAPGGSIDLVRASVERLGAAPDTILIHSAVREHMRSAPAIDALREARACGLARRIGVSTYGIEDAAFGLAQPWVDVVQIEYSILNQSTLRATEYARSDQEVVVRSVLCKGLLTSRRTAAPRLAAQVQDALDGIEQCAREWDHSVEALAIRFALDTPGIDIVLVGVSSRAELGTALSAAAAPRLTHEQWHRLAAFDRRDADAAHPERWALLS
ncbi:MAG TPA: aldo/keto reductase [Vicinamibacterales bacterium]|nr:aldo/keto reductase [Vicinamibacterales bacterium]